jgi:predicted metal-dependent enzyme (double-stranded beta helix superfamily)
MSVLKVRNEIVSTAIQKIRQTDLGEDLSGLEAIRDALVGLAGQTNLFPLSHFPIKPGTSGGIYRLLETPDRRYALYISVGVEGRKQSPHRHPSWAIVAGVSGREHNVIYDRIDDGSTPGKGALRKRLEFDIEPGKGIIVYPGEYHTIEVNGDTPTLHLHFYDYAVDRWTGAYPAFATADATTYRLEDAPPSAIVGIPRLSVGELGEARAAGEQITLIAIGAEAPASAAQSADTIQAPEVAAVEALELNPGVPVVLAGSQTDVQKAIHLLIERGHGNASYLDA